MSFPGTFSGASSPRTAPVWVPWLTLVLLSVPILFYNLGAYGVVSSDEAFNHRVAQNMLESGRWFEIKFGEREYTFLINSPLHFWMRALAIRVLGDNHWSMRILSALFGLSAVLLTYGFARRRLGRLESWLAALILLTSFQFVYLHGARTGELDALVTFAFLWVAYEFLRAVEDSRPFWRHHVALLVLVNLKLPLVILPVLIELIYFARTPEHRHHLRRWVLSGAVLVPLGFAWHLVTSWRDPNGAGYVLSEMLAHAFDRSSERTTGFENDFLFYVRVIFFGMFPYCLAIPFAWKTGGAADEDTRRFERFLRIAAASVFVFFTLIGKKFPWYVMPAYPFLACLVARWLLASVSASGFARPLALVLVVAGVVTVQFDPSLANPFSARHFTFPPPGLDLSVARVALVALVTVGALVLALRPGSPRARRLATVAALVLVVGVGLARTLAPLRFTTYRSPTAILAHDLNARVTRSQPIQFPVLLHQRNVTINEFYFGRHFRIVSPGPRRNPRLVGYRGGSETSSFEQSLPQTP